MLVAWLYMCNACRSIYHSSSMLHVLATCKNLFKLFVVHLIWFGLSVDTVEGQKCRYRSSRWWCYDLMCFFLISGQPHSTKHKTDMPEKNEKQLESIESFRWWKGRRTLDERICGKTVFRAWSGREEWRMVTAVMNEITNWCVWDQMRVIGNS